VVATPGRLWQLMNERGAAAEYLARLDELQFFVLDEADRMVERAHFQELKQLLDRLPRLADESNGKSNDAAAVAARVAEAQEAQQAGRMAHVLDPVEEAAAALPANLTQRPRQTFVFSATLGAALDDALSNSSAVRSAHARRARAAAKRAEKERRQARASSAIPSPFDPRADNDRDNDDNADNADDDDVDVDDDLDDISDEDVSDEDATNANDNAVGNAILKQIENVDQRTAKLLSAIDFQQKK
jgi:hypothetical protein